MDPTELFLFPTDDSRLFQLNRFNSNTGGFGFSLDEVTSGSPVTFYVPLCDEMSTPAFTIDNGLLLGGHTAAFGNEPIFYDASAGSSTIIDLNPNGDSDPVIMELQNAAYVIANTGIIRQLFIYENGGTLTQITNDTTNVVGAVGKIGDDYLYQTLYQDTTGLSVHQVKKATWNGSSYDYSLLSEIVDVASDYEVRWGSPVERNGRLYFLETRYTMSVGLNNSYAVCSNDGSVPFTVHHSLNSTGYTPYSQLFEWDGKLYTCDSGQPELYASTDGVNFTIEYTLPQNHQYVFFHQYGNDLYMATQQVGVETARDIIKYSGGTAQTIHNGKHIHFMTEDNGKLYFEDLGLNGDTSYVGVLDMNNGFMDYFELGVFIHPPIYKASLIHDGAFTFLCGSPQIAATDVWKLENYASVVSIIEEDGISIYPNPITYGQSFTIESKVKSNYRVISADGKLVSEGIIDSGKNDLQSQGWHAGVYLLEIGGFRSRLVIQ